MQLFCWASNKIRFYVRTDSISQVGIYKPPCLVLFVIHLVSMWKNCILIQLMFFWKILGPPRLIANEKVETPKKRRILCALEKKIRVAEMDKTLF